MGREHVGRELRRNAGDRVRRGSSVFSPGVMLPVLAYLTLAACFSYWRSKPHESML